jgi:hypothetical protein
MLYECCSPLFDLAHGDSSDQQATLICIATCERTVFSGRNSNESRQSLPDSALIEGMVASVSCSTSLVDVPKSRLVSWMTTVQPSGAVLPRPRLVLCTAR